MSSTKPEVCSNIQSRMYQTVIS